MTLAAEQTWVRVWDNNHDRNNNNKNNGTGFVYRAYGNVESYTNGSLRFADLSVPLALPRSDWVVSLEVGEHILWRYEAFFLCNLHYHGVILSWASLGQTGYYHSNQYIIRFLNNWDTPTTLTPPNDSATATSTTIGYKIQSWSSVDSTTCVENGMVARLRLSIA